MWSISLLGGQFSKVWDEILKFDSCFLKSSDEIVCHFDKPLRFEQQSLIV